MTNITEMNAATITMIQKELNDAMAAVLSEHGLSHSMGRVTYSNDSYSTKLSINVGDVSDAKKAEYERYAFKFGIPSDSFGKTFTQGSESFTIVGIKPKGKKYPIIAMNKSGKKFGFMANVAGQAV